MEENSRKRSRSRRRTRKSKWADADEENNVDQAAAEVPDWVTDTFKAAPQYGSVPSGGVSQTPQQLRAGVSGGGHSKPNSGISKEMEIPSAVMGHVIGPKGATISTFRQATGVHVQVISNPQMPFGKLQIGPGALESVDQCVTLVNEKLLDYVARGQAQAQATGVPANIPPTMLDERGEYVAIVAKEIDAAAQLAELQDLGPAYPGGIVKELTIPATLMGGIIGPRQSTLAQIRKAAKVRIEIASQPKVGTASEGVLRVGPAPPDIIAKCEELIQMKSEELLGQRPRTNPLTFQQMAAGGDPGAASHKGAGGYSGGEGGKKGGYNSGAGDYCPPGMEVAEVEVPKELMGAMIGSQGSGIERLKASFAASGIPQMSVSISQNPSRDPTVNCGKLKVGPGAPDQVAVAAKIVEERVKECEQMRDMSKGGGKFDGGKGKGKSFNKGYNKGGWSNNYNQNDGGKGGWNNSKDGNNYGGKYGDPNNPNMVPQGHGGGGGMGGPMGGGGGMMGAPGMGPGGPGMNMNNNPMAGGQPGPPGMQPGAMNPMMMAAQMQNLDPQQQQMMQQMMMQQQQLMQQMMQSGMNPMAMAGNPAAAGDAAQPPPPPPVEQTS
ncbi:unnamed protein product [Amoebophrya sp. A120]|nr:unnamed protein product [Amoebophrya sp. A120]|eukprot:GSA120T00006267001.1